MTKSETKMCLNTISPQFDVESKMEFGKNGVWKKCSDDALFSQANKISVFGEYGTMVVVYGSSGAYYRLVLEMLELLFGLNVRLEINCICNPLKVTILALLGIS